MKALFKNTIFVAVLIGTSISLGYSQGMRAIDSLKIELSKPLHDTSRVNLLVQIGYEYRVIQLDSSKIYCMNALTLARSIGYKRGEAFALSIRAWVYRFASDYYNAQQCLAESEKIASSFGYQSILANVYHVRSLVCLDLKDYKQSKELILKAREIYSRLGNERSVVTTILTLYDLLDSRGQYDTAFVVAKNLYQFAFRIKAKGTYGIASSKLARAYLRLNKLDSAVIMTEKTLFYGADEKNTRVLIFGNQLKGELFERMNQIDSAIFYIKKAYQLSINSNFYSNALQSSSLLTSLYHKKNDTQNAYKYLTITSTLKDSVQGIEKVIGLQRLLIEEQNKAYTLKEEIIINSNKRKQNIFLGLAGIFMSLILIQVWNNKRVQKSRDREKEQKQTIEKAFAELRSTQNQLIQSEKLASLGELTAGIAHEIQNPLNFVNNFSELSVELIEECPQPPKGANEDWIPQEAPFGGWGAFFGDLKQNLEKINLHGKRASSIVKGMLEHSRTSSGVKELTDMNKLADEYLRLSYHGLRAKDKTFNADFELIADETLPKISVIPQDMGRVLLNLINNAFQSSPPTPRGGAVISKKVMVRTHYFPDKNSPSGGWGAFSVSDNGSGIPESVLPKIFQPFFTTKPTGQGTGLGLSLAYDIVTKGHGGTIEVESMEGEGTTFTIRLPLA